LIESIELHHFRGFEDLKISGFARLNLIAGRNDVGKTALLEALVLSNEPRLNGFFTAPPLVRPVAFTRPAPTSPENWAWLFHGRNVSRDLNVMANRSEGMWSRLTLHVNAPEALQFAAATGVPESGREALLRLHDASFRVQGEFWDGRRLQCDVPLTLGGLRLPPDVPETGWTGSMVYAAGSMLGPELAADWVGKLIAERRIDALVEALRTIEPRLKRLFVVGEHGAALVKADIGLGEAAPLGTLGDGFIRLACFLGQALVYQKKLLIIDEIENGFHASALRDALRALRTAVRAGDHQLFATTHSQEALDAAAEVFDESGEFRLFRLEIGRSGEIRAVRLDRDQIRTALSLGWEIR
jgi:ABC-type branched-subunit amino acid transport system ATPase component